MSALSPVCVALGMLDPLLEACTYARLMDRLWGLPLSLEVLAPGRDRLPLTICLHRQRNRHSYRKRSSGCEGPVCWPVPATAPGMGVHLNPVGPVSPVDGSEQNQ